MEGHFIDGNVLFFIVYLLYNHVSILCVSYLSVIVGLSVLVQLTTKILTSLQRTSHSFGQRTEHIIEHWCYSDTLKYHTM
jgi:hypothetical protein